MSSKLPRFYQKNKPFKKLKRKLSNALESFLYNCATRNQQAILPTAIACRCPSYKLFDFEDDIVCFFLVGRADFDDNVYAIERGDSVERDIFAIEGH